MVLKYFASALLVALSACATIPDTLTEKIGARQVEFVLQRSQKPVVVLENGLGGRLEGWAKVFPEIAKDTTVFSYNRAGYGKSDEAISPRDGEHIVEELRALLRGKALEPPYVLVGHSLGGLYMQWFARRYPEEVVALILVDSTHPRQLRGQGALENWPAAARAAVNLMLNDTGKKELAAVNVTGDHILAMPSVIGKPVLILNATQRAKTHSALEEDSLRKLSDLVNLYPGSKLIPVESGHFIPLEKPEAVIEAIRSVLNAAP